MMPAQAGLLDEARSIFAEVRGLAQDRLQLAALETRLAGQSAVRMLVAGVVALIVYAGLSAVVALALAAVVNLAAAGGLYLAIKKMSRNLTFPRTVGSLQ